MTGQKHKPAGSPAGSGGQFDRTGRAQRAVAVPQTTADHLVYNPNFDDWDDDNVVAEETQTSDNTQTPAKDTWNATDGYMDYTSRPKLGAYRGGGYLAQPNEHLDVAALRKIAKTRREWRLNDYYLDGSDYTILKDGWTTTEDVTYAVMGHDSTTSFYEVSHEPTREYVVIIVDSDGHTYPLSNQHHPSSKDALRSAAYSAYYGELPEGHERYEERSKATKERLNAKFGDGRYSS
jgi:hypothetical protein